MSNPESYTSIKQTIVIVCCICFPYLTMAQSVNWQQIGNGLPEKSEIRSMDSDGTEIVALIAAPEVTARPYRSTDGGLNWSQVNATESGGVIYIKNKLMMIGTNSALVPLRISTDGGASFAGANGFPPTGNVSFIEEFGGIVYANIGAAIYRSTDNGANWSELDTTTLASGSHFVLASPNDGLDLFTTTTASNGVHVYHSGNGGTDDWSLVSNGSSAGSLDTQNIGLLGHQGNVYGRGAFNALQGVWHTTDLGSTWEHVNFAAHQFDYGNFLSTRFAAGSTGVYIAGYQYGTGVAPFPTFIKRTTDGGSSWISIPANGLLHDKPTFLDSAAGFMFLELINKDGIRGFYRAAISDLDNFALPPGQVSVVGAGDKNAGDSITLTATVTSGTAPFNFQWRKDGSDLLGQTSATLSIPIATLDDSGTYSVVVSNSGGTSSSADAAIAVIQRAPVFTLHPENLRRRPGNNITLKVTVVGAEPISLQWYQDDNILAGETGTELVLSNLSDTHIGSYTAKASNAFTADTPIVSNAGSVNLLHVFNITEFGAGTTTRLPRLHRHGDPVVIQAFPLPGYQFLGWRGDVTGPATENPITFNMLADTNLTAAFGITPTDLEQWLIDHNLATNAQEAQAVVLDDDHDDDDLTTRQEYEAGTHPNNPNQTTTHTLTIKRGLNFVALPIQPALDASPYTLLNPSGESYVDSVWELPVGSRRAKRLVVIKARRAFWINANQDYDIVISGEPVISTTLTLLPGWNSIGTAIDDATLAANPYITPIRITETAGLRNRDVKEPLAAPLKQGNGYRVLARRATTIEFTSSAP